MNEIEIHLREVKRILYHLIHEEKQTPYGKARFEIIFRLVEMADLFYSGNNFRLLRLELFSLIKTMRKVQNRKYNETGD